MQQTDINRERAIRLFTFLREFSQLRTKTIRSIDQYEQVLWLSEIPKVPNCYCIAWKPDEASRTDIWIEIQKPKIILPPSVPKTIQPWLNPLDTNNSSIEFPSLYDRIPVEEPGEPDENGKITNRTVFHNIDEYPEVKGAWELYIQEEWWPWAEKDRILKSVQRVYTGLFAIYQQQQRLGEAYEVVLGAGYLTWRTPTGQTVKRHIVVAQTSLSFDAVRGRITVGPSIEGIRTTLEEDMLEPEERPDVNELRAIEKLIDDMGDAFWSDGRIHTILRSWINTIVDSKEYSDTLGPQDTVDRIPQIHFAPAIILRKRTERSLVRVFKEICEQLNDPQNQLPEGIDNLIKDPDSTRHFDDNWGSDDSIPTPGVSEIYFPLHANNEQIEIAKQIAMKQGVLVQGPPGTGKSHTIVNLVCHLLAVGKKVLVTSHTPRALSVLRNMFPEEIAPLCVVALSDDLRSMKGLESSVSNITTRHNYWNPTQNKRDIDTYEKELDKARREEATKLLELRAIREAETFSHPKIFDVYEGTLQRIASRLHSDEGKYAWMSNIPKEEDELPLAQAEAIELLRLLREFDSKAEDELNRPLADLNDLLLPLDFANLVRNEAKIRSRYDAILDIRQRPEYKPLISCTSSQRKSLIESLVKLKQAYELMSQDIQLWVKNAAHQIMAGRDQQWLELSNITKHHTTSIGKRARDLSKSSITGLDNRDLSVVKAHVMQLIEHLKNGGRLGAWIFRSNTVKEGIYLIKEVRFDGQLCKNLDALQRLAEWIDVENHFSNLKRHWQIHTIVPDSMYSIRKAEYENLQKSLENCLSLKDLIKISQNAIADINGLSEPAWHTIDSIYKLEETANAVDLEEELREARSVFKKMKEKLEGVNRNPIVHPIVNELIENIRQRNVEEYSENYEKHSKLKANQKRLIKRDELYKRLSGVAESLAEDLKITRYDKLWDDRLANFSSAWNWARADRWLRRLRGPYEQERIRKTLDTLRQNINQYMAKLVAAKAWRHCLSRLTDHESSHLRAWQLAVRRVGRGFSIHANRYRREARDNMEECRSAIPAWIMPIYRVAETIDIKPNIFDVVIVDEASQSGPEALFLQYIARKIVVVGDDKQISPQFIGLEKQDVVLLRERIIPDLHFKDALGIEHSFFDQAFIRYRGQISLREHFRCMPEIIQFSNNLCYKSRPLIPLKQYGSGRLEPSVATKYVPNGYQKGRNPRITNPPEAEEIVECIVKCCANISYDGKTMGVISLLGEEQAKLIKEILMNRIGPEEMEKRLINCGDAYEFQGDERDVMFLSMVSAVGEHHRIGTLTSSEAEKRFNVAASRAKEQMWLFHSVTLSDLSPLCLRYRLLDYCLHPKIDQTDVSGINIDNLRILAETAHRFDEKPPDPFDSWFEVDVFLRIIDRGYRVLPQYRIAEYRVDLMVEGMKGRLAVECDGDMWHGPDRYDYDCARRRQIERSGYQFWTILGSVYYRDPDGALQSLWATLKQLGIHPEGETESRHSEESRTDQSTHEESSTDQSTYREGNTDRDTDIDDEMHADEEASEDIESLVNNHMVEVNIPNADRISKKSSDESAQRELDFNKDIIIGDDALVRPYQNWMPRTLPNPEDASIPEIANGLIDIVTVEGPMICYRAYRIYSYAVGIKRIGKQIRSVFNRAMRRAIASGKLEERNEYNLRDQIHKVVRIARSEPVLLRKRGDRTIDEIPPSEIACLIKHIVNHSSPRDTNEKKTILREVLSYYELKRLTDNTNNVLERAWSIYESTKNN